MYPPSGKISADTHVSYQFQLKSIFKSSPLVGGKLSGNDDNHVSIATKPEQAIVKLQGMAEHRFSNIYILKLNKRKKVNNDNNSLASLYKLKFVF